MKTSALIIFALCGPILAAPEARAAEEGLDSRIVLAAGGGYPKSGGVFVAVRVRYLPHTPFALEMNIYAPYGIGAGWLLDVYRNDRLRVHAFDIGFFEDMLPIAKVSRSDIDRLFDVTLGCGLEWKVTDKHVFSLDWRVFLADPFSVPFRYGNLAVPIYRDAFIGGQLWLGYVFD